MSSPANNELNQQHSAPPTSGFSRRRLLGAAGVGVALAGTAGAAYGVGHASAAGRMHGELHGPVPFRGQRQAGIVTAAQDGAITGAEWLTVAVAAAAAGYAVYRVPNAPADPGA